MTDKSTALGQISDALGKLEDARNTISDLLLNRSSQAKGSDFDKQTLEDLHKRVTQAITVLPHSGRNTVNSTKGRNEF